MVDGSPIEHSVPFSMRRQGLVKVTSRTERRKVCVVGNTAEDHALAVLCDRIFDRASWIPTELLQAGDSRAKALKSTLDSVLSEYDSNFEPCALVSVSEDEDFLQSLMRHTVLQINGKDVSLPDRAQVLTLHELAEAAEGGTCALGDAVGYDRQQTVPLVSSPSGFAMLAPIDFSAPRALDAATKDLEWFTDVRLSGHAVAARSALRSSTLSPQSPGSMPEAKVRASRTGLAYSSERQGFVVGGSSLEARTARPLLTFVSGFQTFRELAAKVNYSIELSAAGRRAVNVVQMWGSFCELASDLQGDVGRLLDGFIPPNNSARTGAYENGCGYSIRGEGYLTFEDAQKVLRGSSQAYTRSILDRLIKIRVIQRGLLLNCEHCLRSDHYNMDSLSSSGFVCVRCESKNSLVGDRWQSRNAEPTWTYGLATVVRDLICENGDVPILATSLLSENSKSSVWCAEIKMVEDDRDWVELDIAMINDGKIVVGEAKSISRISGRKSGALAAARKLVRAAYALTADEIVLATSQTSWSENVIPAVTKAIEETWLEGAKPKLTTLLNVREHRRIGR